MFELSVACKYLTPRWRQLSVSIISLISILVIALVVWLIVVFFSVTQGLEKGWIQKLTALTAPVRILPTEAYYRSYYYQIDSLSAHSGYAHKAIHEKLYAPTTNPYDPDADQEIPSEWPAADFREDGTLKDLVKDAIAAASSLRDIPGLSVQDFEVSVGNLRLHLLRPHSSQSNERYLSQTAYIGSLEADNKALRLIPLTAEDRANLPAPLLVQSLPELLSGSAQKLVLPSDVVLGDGLLLPKSFKDAGALAGDRGYLSYYAPTTSTVLEQFLPVYVAGFYDPGIFPIGGKFALANREVVSTIRPENHTEDAFITNGINVRFDNIEQANQVKAELEAAFQKAGILPYWHIETYQEFEFTKDLIQQLRSERNLWTLIAAVIIIVACSNIISMLIILVNDKKTEIGILRSMGASSLSIACIFGICGIIMGAVGSILGTIAAIFTLHNLQLLVNLIGSMQGHELFNPLFYGDTLPNQISGEVLLFVIIATSLISLLAGIVPAIKACMLRPSTILRSE